MLAGSMCALRNIILALEVPIQQDASMVSACRSRVLAS